MKEKDIQDLLRTIENLKSTLEEKDVTLDVYKVLYDSDKTLIDSSKTLLRSLFRENETCNNQIKIPHSLLNKLKAVISDPRMHTIPDDLLIKSRIELSLPHVAPEMFDFCLN